MTWGCKEEGKERNLYCSGCMNNTRELLENERNKKREKKGRKRTIRLTCLNTNILIR